MRALIRWLLIVSASGRRPLPPTPMPGNRPASSRVPEAAVERSQ